MAQIRPPGDGVVAAVHGVLDGVAEDEQQDHVEGADVTHLAAAGESEQDGEKDVDDDATQDELPPRQRHLPHSCFSRR